MSKHTPLPWVISNQFSSANYIQIRPHIGHKGYPICKVKDLNKFVQGSAQANAALIVKAVNNHEALLNEIQIAVDRFKPDHCVTCINYEDPMRCDCGEHKHLQRMKQLLKGCE